MDIKRFNQLPKEEQYSLLCKRIEEMKKGKLTTKEFKNEEFNFSWPSQKIKEMGYWLDQTDYVLRPYARDDEMVIKKREYQRLVAIQEQKGTINKEEHERTIARLKKEIENLKNQDSMETLLSPYMESEKTTYYTKIPERMIEVWNEFAVKQVCGKQHSFELALIKYMKKYSKETLFNKAKHFNMLSGEDIKYHTIAISVSEKLINEWKGYCKEVKLFTAGQYTTDALMEMMNITLEALRDSDIEKNDEEHSDEVERKM